MKIFKNHIRFENVLIRLGGVGACGGTDTLSNFLISARSQTSHWATFFVYAIEQITHQEHLLNAPVPPGGYLPANVKVTQHFLVCLVHLRVLFSQEVKLLRSRNVFFIGGIF